ncbi:MAG: hypothetical protein ACRDPO_39605 [Streptosporangiaceae bacterium]
MGDLRPDQTSVRRPGRKATRAAQGRGLRTAATASGAPEAPPAVRAALGKLRDAAAAHDEELRAPRPPRSQAAH